MKGVQTCALPVSERQAINAVKFQPLLLYIEAAFVYLIFSTVLTQIQGMLEKKLGKHLVDTRV